MSQRDVNERLAEDKQTYIRTTCVFQYSVHASLRRNGKRVGYSCSSLLILPPLHNLFYIRVLREHITIQRTHTHTFVHWIQNRKTQNSTVCIIAMQIIYQIPTFPWFHFKPFVLLSSLDTNRDRRWRGGRRALKAIS